MATNHLSEKDLQLLVSKIVAEQVRDKEMHEHYTKSVLAEIRNKDLLIQEHQNSLDESRSKMIRQILTQELAKKAKTPATKAEKTAESFLESAGILNVSGKARSLSDVLRNILKQKASAVVKLDNGKTVILARNPENDNKINVYNTESGNTEKPIFSLEISNDDDENSEIEKITVDFQGKFAEHKTPSSEIHTMETVDDLEENIGAEQESSEEISELQPTLDNEKLLAEPLPTQESTTQSQAKVQTTLDLLSALFAKTSAQKEKKTVVEIKNLENATQNIWDMLEAYASAKARFQQAINFVLLTNVYSQAFFQPSVYNAKFISVKSQDEYLQDNVMSNLLKTK